MGVHVILGHFGYTFSSGFAEFGTSLKMAGYPVTIHAIPQDINTVIAALEAERANEPRCLLGFSLGGNACAWTSDRERRTFKRSFDLIIAFDPTRNGPDLKNYPIRNSRRTICFCGVGYWPTSWFWGGGHLSGDNVEHIPTTADHLAVQYNGRLRDIARRELARVYQR